jgi:exodeoxyribonuclease V alpha subunit
MSHARLKQIAGSGASPETRTQHLSGAVERITFHNEESGFCVLRVKVRDRRDLITVVGTAAAVAPGEFIECDGAWVHDRTHGLQFKSRQLRTMPPSTLEGIEKYLASGLVKGIGPHLARELVGAFGERVFQVIERTPARLTEIVGIGPKRKAFVVAAWAEQKAVRAIMVFLQSHGVGAARAARIYETYGDHALDRVRENPYRLALDVHGIGFKSADAIARRLGIPVDSLIRAQAGVQHILQDLSSQGHCAAERERLVEITARFLEIAPSLVERAVEGEIAAGKLIAEAIEGTECLYLVPIHRAESQVAAQLLRLLAGQPPWDSIDASKAIPWVEGKTRRTLSASQRRAVERVISGKVSVITGGPGVGKTTVVNSILRILSGKRVRSVLCAPTGRAAKRLSESTGRKAQTIHRLLEFDPRRYRFKRGAHDPLRADLVVMDEASMVDVILMSQLLAAVPDHAGLLIVGDVDQLPSVGPGAVLADVIASLRVPTVRLTEIFRQAAASTIIVNAHRINRGRMPRCPDTELADFYFVAADTPEEIRGKLLEAVIERIPRRFGLHPVYDVQVLTPMNRGGLGARSLNAELQQRLNPGATPTVTRFGSTYGPGDKVIQTVNDYDKGVFNGDIGRVSGVDADAGLVHVDFGGRRVEYKRGELDELSLAYAITVHKSQGSEYAAVVIPLAVQHYPLLQRNLLYTAVTRGRTLVVIVGEPKALAIAVKSVSSARRLTNLTARLARGAGAGKKST